MSRSFALSPLADDDVRRICEYVSAGDVRVADALDRRFQARFRLIAAVPGVGRSRSDVFHPDVLFAWMGKYGIAYSYNDRGVLIVRVFHGAQDIRRVFGRPLT